MTRNIARWETFFRAGMKHSHSFIPAVYEPSLELGPGNNSWGATYELDFPEWDGNEDDIPFADGQIATIFAFHFLEHLSPDGLIHCLRECQRVLKCNGVMMICVPFYRAELAWRDPDHRTFYTEHTWNTIFKNDYYDKNKKGWHFDVKFNMIMGDTERNLALLTQLVKSSES